MVDLGDLQDSSKESYRKTEHPDIVCVHDHDPVLDEVRSEALFPDQGKDPVNSWSHFFVLKIFRKSILLFVFLALHDAESDVDYRSKLLVFSESKEKLGILL